jgi:phosphoenolpyruvate synthase/pyruvate phosphate dikinase
VDQAFQDLLRDKLAGFSEDRIRFRSSTNAEDLDGFTGAGLYTSNTGVKSDWDDVLDAVRTVWSSVWFFRAFEERAFRSIDHRAVGLALLVHMSFPDPYEAANGVALTGNPFDPSGLEPGFYVNVQAGAVSVVQPDTGATTDQFIYHFGSPGQPVVYQSRSSLAPEGQNVLAARQIHELGEALEAIHRRFSPAYGPAAGNQGFYAMDTEFKFYIYDEGAEPELVVKQARPHPGRGR